MVPFNLTSLNFDQMSNSQRNELLSSGYDISNCLMNCTNNGGCNFDQINNKFICLCTKYFTGPACQIDTRPCSSDPCLNNATCYDYSNPGNYNTSINNSTGFYCACINNLYQGQYCESKIDVCQNETCSNNGNCVDYNSVAKCECFSMFQGDKCNAQSEELKTVKAIISIASIIAIGAIIFFYLCIFGMDCTKYACRKSNRIKPKRAILKKFVYVNF